MNIILAMKDIVETETMIAVLWGEAIKLL